MPDSFSLFFLCLAIGPPNCSVQRSGIIRSLLYWLCVWNGDEGGVNCMELRTSQGPDARSPGLSSGPPWDLVKFSLSLVSKTGQKNAS